MDLMLRTVRADFAVCETYTLSDERPLECPISAFAGNRDRAVEPVSVQAWRDHTTSEFSFWMLPGDHFFVHHTDHLLLRIIFQDWGESDAW